MAYYNDYKKKKMTKADHLREDVRKAAEGYSVRFPRGGDKVSASAGYGKKKEYNKTTDMIRRRTDGDRKTSQKSRAIPSASSHTVVENGREDLLTGRNPIREALKAGRDIEKILVAKGDLSGTAQQIVAVAREMRVPVQMVERARLDALADNHQGMIAFASAYQYADTDDIINEAKQRNEDPFIVILDGVTDPHNLGAVIRTAAAAGAHGVIVPERRAVGLTPAAVKASAGAVEHIRVARVMNLTNEIKRLKSMGIWVYGTALEGEDYRDVDFKGPCALIIGSEGDGISRLVREQCDRIVSLPMKNPAIESLNASVAAGILLYAAMTARDR